MILLDIFQFLQCVTFFLNHVSFYSLCFQFGKEFIDCLGKQTAEKCQLFYSREKSILDRTSVIPDAVWIEIVEREMDEILRS